MTASSHTTQTRSASMHRNRLITAALATATAAGLSALTGVQAPAASAEIPITAGDGGIVEQTCGTTPVQIRVDSANATGGKVCFGLVKDSGWVAVNITGSYGVVNNLTVPVTVAFKLPNGAVYWSTNVNPGEVKTVDVNRSGSTVVELQVSPVTSPTGPSTGQLTPGTEQPTVVSLRNAASTTTPRVLRVSWSGVVSDVINRNSGFTDRLDASFIVTPGLSNTECVSLESAAYPGVFLQTTDGTTPTVTVSSTPDATAATWCATAVSSPATSVRLISAADQRYALSTTTAGAVSVTTTRAADSAWFVDQGLAYPGTTTGTTTGK